MSAALVKKKFEKMGAKVNMTSEIPSRLRYALGGPPEFNIDFRNGVFEIYTAKPDKVEIMDVRPKERHLLLMARMNDGNAKFLCGHDERNWFVASAGENVSNVAEAKDHLMPNSVREAQKASGVNHKKRHQRHTEGSHRQGEWFFTPAPDFVPGKKEVIHKKEPMVRSGGGKPHVVDECIRHGGKLAYINTRDSSDVLTPQKFAKIDAFEKRYYRQATSGAKVYVRGRVRHPDHATLVLNGWHVITPNSEKRMLPGGGRASMTFYD